MIEYIGDSFLRMLVSVFVLGTIVFIVPFIRAPIDREATIEMIGEPGAYAVMHLPASLFCDLPVALKGITVQQPAIGSMQVREELLTVTLLRHDKDLRIGGHIPKMSNVTLHHMVILDFGFTMFYLSVKRTAYPEERQPMSSIEQKIIHEIGTYHAPNKVALVMATNLLLSLFIHLLIVMPLYFCLRNQ